MEKITTSEELKTFVQNAGDKACCIKVGAGWCSPCRTLEKIIGAIEPEYAEKVIFADIEADDIDDDFMAELNVTNIPVMIFYKNGLQVDRTVGMIGREALINKIEENYAK
jgi:thioredoxin 1